jgi:transposase
LERTALSKKEVRRAEVLARVKSGELKVTEAAEQMKTSYRNAKRLWKRYQEGGAEALKHGNAGRTSNYRSGWSSPSCEGMDTGAASGGTRGA